MSRLTLWLIRHAKSDWHSGTASDFDRPLNARGERDGPRMAAWLSAQGEAARWIWSSDAARACRTAGFVAAALPDAEVVLEHRLYNAGPEQILDVIRETPADVVSAAVVGHNPGMTSLLNLLAGHQVIDNLPTFGVARLTVPAPWSTLVFGSGEVELVTSPKRLPEPSS